MRISEGANFEQMAIDIVVHAMLDLVHGYRWKGKSTSPKIHIMTKLKAFEFLVSDDLRFWADVAGRDFDVKELLKNAVRMEQELEAYSRASKKKRSKKQ